MFVFTLFPWATSALPATRPYFLPMDEWNEGTFTALDPNLDPSEDAYHSLTGPVFAVGLRQEALGKQHYLIALIRHLVTPMTFFFFFNAALLPFRLFLTGRSGHFDMRTQTGKVAQFKAVLEAA